MVGVEFVRDRATREPDGDLPDRADRRLRRCRPARPDLRPPARDRALDPAARRHRGRDRRGGRDLRRDARIDAARLSRRPGRTRAPVPRAGAPSARREVRPVRPVVGSAVLRQELHDVVESEPTIAALAHAVERKLAAIAQPLHRVDVQVKHVGNFGRGEHRSQFVDGHRCHVVCSLALHAISTVRVPGVFRGRVRPAAWRSV